MTPTTAHAVVDLLAAAGVRRAYTVPGESFLGLLQALDDDERMTLVSTRHEGGASFMAEAEAKLTGTPALALASRGPGAANLAIGVHTAHQDQTPMLVLLGQVDSGDMGREAFQEVDLAAFFAPISTWSENARRAQDVPALVAEAVRQATTGRPGPAVLSVPADFWSVPYDSALSATPKTDIAPDLGAAAAAARELAAIISGATNPVAIAGPGQRIGRRELATVAERFGIGVYPAFRRQDSFAADDPRYLGHLGLGVPADLRQALDAADVVLVLGTRLDAITSQDFHYPRPQQHLVLVGEDLPVPAHPGPATRFSVAAQPVLAALAQLDPPASRAERDWTTSHAAASAFAQLSDSTTTEGVHPGAVVSTLRQLAPTDSVVTNDAGNFAAFVHRYWSFTTDHRQLGPCNGAMGYAVPAALAAKLAAPERQVIATVGDGGILMTGHEIETAVRLGAGILVVAFRNGTYGTIAMHQALANGKLAGVDIGDVDLATWARGLGARGLSLERAADITPVLTEALAASGPVVVDVRTDPDIIAPGRSLQQLLS